MVLILYFVCLNPLLVPLTDSGQIIIGFLMLQNDSAIDFFEIVTLS
jgi:hypothetical protein